MTRWMIVGALLLCAGLVLADSSAPPAPVPHVPGQTQGRRGRRRLTPEQQMERFGGFVERERAGRVCSFADAQGRVPGGTLELVARQIERTLSIPVVVARAEARDAGAFPPPGPSGGAGAVVSVIDLPGRPSLLVAPENGWAQVNVAALAGDAPAPDVLDARVRKELWRAFVLLFGGGNSSASAQDLMRPVNSLADLDARPGLVPGPEPFNAVLDGARARGIAPVHRTTYRQACVEGWAPTPTNDAQRVIWDETHRIPATPLKIEFDPKRGR
ncbi:MAG: hypothetical protein ACI4RA_07105 [Kiritimatiellia bacterium]